MKIVIAGASGFIGEALSKFLKSKGHEVVELSRSQKEGSRYWNPEKKEIHLEAMEGADAIINLAGESVFGRWTEEKKKKIRASRVETTAFLADSILKMKRAPKLYIGASAIGYYGDRGERKLSESEKAGDDFLSEVCREWEGASERLKEREIRVVSARLGIVFGSEGGALKQILPFFKSGLGGKIGTGEQFTSWIALEDLLEAIEFILHHEELQGPLNISSPHPITNQEMTKSIGEVLSRPTVATVPSWAAKLMFGEGATIFLSSIRAVPEKLLKAGFHFKFSDLSPLLEKICK